VRAAPKQKMAADWEGLTVGGGGGQKHTRDYGGSVTGVDEIRSRLVVGGGERESLAVRGKIWPATGAAHFQSGAVGRQRRGGVQGRGRHMAQFGCVALFEQGSIRGR
jgi:hypothetical protein